MNQNIDLLRIARNDPHEYHCYFDGVILVPSRTATETRTLHYITSLLEMFY